MYILVCIHTTVATLVENEQNETERKKKLNEER